MQRLGPRRAKGRSSSSAWSLSRPPRGEAVTPGLKIAINSTPTHFFCTRYFIEYQKMSYTLLLCQKVPHTLCIVSKSIFYIQLISIFNPGVTASISVRTDASEAFAEDAALHVAFKSLLSAAILQNATTGWGLLFPIRAWLGVAPDTTNASRKATVAYPTIERLLFQMF